MKTWVVPEDQWLSYLNDLSVLKRRSQVRVETAEHDRGDKVVVADRVPLLGITPEMKGSAACAVDIEVGAQRLADADGMTHSVLCTSQLVVEEDERGEPRELDIIGEDPTTRAKVTTIVRFL